MPRSLVPGPPAIILRSCQLRETRRSSLPCESAHYHSWLSPAVTRASSPKAALASSPPGSGMRKRAASTSSGRSALLRVVSISETSSTQSTSACRKRPAERALHTRSTAGDSESAHASASSSSAGYVSYVSCMYRACILHVS